jgi:hypothetical protein
VLTYNDLTSKTVDKIVPRIVDSVFKNSPVLTRLKNKRRFQFEGGLTIRHNIMYAPLKGGSYQRGQAFDTSAVQTDTALYFNVKQYYVNVTLYGSDQVLNRGPEGALSFIGSKMINASGTMAQLLAINLYGDGGLNGSTSLNSTTDLDGAAVAINIPANYPTYGGVTRTDIASAANTGINAYYAAPSAFSLGAVQTAYGASWFGQEKVDMITTTQPVWDAMWNKLQPSQRFNDETSDVHVGFRSFFWNGAQVVVDQYLSTLGGAYQMYGFNTNYIFFYVSTIPKYAFGFSGWKEAQNTDDVAGQYFYDGDLVFDAPRLMFNLNFSGL